MRHKSNNCSSKIDDKTRPEDIADHFSNIYKDLFNRTGTNQPLKDILDEVNAKIEKSDIEHIKKVTPKLIQMILSQKIKAGKQTQNLI